MRRISSQHAQPGMELSRDVYDHYGNLLLEEGTRLKLDNISILAQMGGEIFYEDARVEDIPVNPMQPARLEGNAASQFREMVDEINKSLPSGQVTPVDSVPLTRIIHSMVETLFPLMMGELNAAGCYSLKDYNYIHPVQVTTLSLAIGKKLGLKREELAELGLASMLQNLGYLALPHGILDDTGSLLEMETHEVHQHSQYGYQIATDYLQPPPSVVNAILEHHERWDGSGYPRGLKGEEISLFARIIGIGDTYYALTSRRPYRQRFLQHEATEFVMAFSGELFDPSLSQLFSGMMPLYPTGVMVKLNTGESGIIADARPGYIGRPTIRVCYDKHYTELSKPYSMDLTDSQHQHRLVTEIVEY